MNVAVDPARGDDRSFGGDDLGAGPDREVDALLNVGIAGLSDSGDAAFANADVGFDDPPPVDDQRIGHDEIERAFGLRERTLTHSVADHFAAAELYFVAVDGAVSFDFDDQLRVGQTNAVAGRRAEVIDVGAPLDAAHRPPSNGPSIAPWKPTTLRSPAKGTRRTRRSSPGSKRTAVPATMSRCVPRAEARSKISASLVSAK